MLRQFSGVEKLPIFLTPIKGLRSSDQASFECLRRTARASLFLCVAENVNATAGLRSISQDSVNKRECV